MAPRVAIVHGQHEPQGLLDPASHLARLDAFAGLSEEVVAVGLAHAAWRGVMDSIDRLHRDQREGERRREMLEYQATEIEKAGLVAGEEDELRREKVVQANAGRLMALADEAYTLLFEDEGAVVTRLGVVQKRLADLAAIDTSLEASASALPPLRAQIDDLALVLRDYREGLSVTPGRVDEIESRLAVIERLKKKYGATVEEVLAFAEACRRDLVALGNPEEEGRAPRGRTPATGRGLRRGGAEGVGAPAGSRPQPREAGRVGAATSRDGADAVRGALHAGDHRGRGRGLGNLDGRRPGDGGIPDVTEPGRGAAAPGAHRFGGELSRVMLALMSAGRLDENAATLVFDEADAGIGGRVAEVVGKKLRAMAAHHQVLCVTHLPQIAALAHHHVAIEKKVVKGRTITEVRTLSATERVEEIARMLGGENITARTREHAREMLSEHLKN
jgi:DNA repair protein RecN (Recombination protein N)